MTTPSSSKVLGITELLEKILLALPTKDILLSQRVCKAWRQTTQGSKKLQQALFFKAAGVPIPSSFLSVGGGSDASKVSSNPLLKPLIRTTSQGDAQVDSSGRLTLHKSWEYPTASWRSMLLVQPPWLRVPIIIRLQRLGVTVMRHATDARNETGVTMQEVLNHVKYHRKKKALECLRMACYRDGPTVTATFEIVGASLWKDSKVGQTALQ